MSRSIVLCATDFSNASELALTHARIFARSIAAKMLLVHVISTSDSSAEQDAEHNDQSDSDLAESENRLTMIQKSIGDVPCEFRIVHGDPAHEILAIAEKEDVELIVMGTHGRTGLMRLLMGSVAEHVVREANCPVLTVRLPGGEKE